MAGIACVAPAQTAGSTPAWKRCFGSLGVCGFCTLLGERWYWPACDFEG